MANDFFYHSCRPTPKTGLCPPVIYIFNKPKLFIDNFPPFKRRIYPNDYVVM